ncbi:hypothetical protein Ae201684P_009739 [Aphanomyces euteiches]|nr:hypothetical protein Ae201684P_009739 [Aphanomyces euteiches]
MNKSSSWITVTPKDEIHRKYWLLGRIKTDFSAHLSLAGAKNMDFVKPVLEIVCQAPHGTVITSRDLPRTSTLTIEATATATKKVLSPSRQLATCLMQYL